MADIQVFRYYNNGDYHDVVSYTSATHEEGLDGTDKLTITCKEAMRKRAHLLWQDELHKWHEHIVVSSVRKHNRRKVEKTYVCSNSVDELYLTLAEGTVLKGTVSQIMNKLVANTRWTSSGNDAFGGEVFELETWHKNVRECITELIDMCGGEINTWIMCGDYGVEKRIVRILEERNNARGEIPMRQFTYGKNMVNVQRTLSPDEVYTAIVGYGKKKLEIELEAKDPDTMTDAERESYNEQLAAARENPYLERLSVTVKSNTSVDKYGVMGASGEMGHAWMTYTDDACSDKEFLKKQCETLIDVYSKPLITYDFDVYQLEDDRWKYVKLGNYIHVVDDEMQFDSIERISYVKRELKGRDSCRISIGKRINPIVEKFKADERKERKTTGNSTKAAATQHVTTHNNYSGGSYTRPTYTPSSGGYSGGFQSYGGATTEDRWIHQIDGVTQHIGVLNFTNGGSDSAITTRSAGITSFAGATVEDKWAYQIEGMTKAIGTVNFVTKPSNDPDHIKIVVLPNKTNYNLGDAIDFTGMVVKVYDAAGNVCDIYPDGVIPFEDLILPITTASNYAIADSTDGLSPVMEGLVIPYGSAELLTFDGIYKSGQDDNNRQAVMIASSSDPVYAFGFRYPKRQTSSGYLYGFSYFLCSKSWFSGSTFSHNEYGSYANQLNVVMDTVNGKTFYTSNSVRGTYDDPDRGSIQSIPDENYSISSSEVSYVILFSQGAGGVPAQWERPSDGKILEDTFTIEVTADKTNSSGGGDF